MRRPPRFPASAAAAVLPLVLAGALAAQSSAAPAPVAPTPAAAAAGYAERFAEVKALAPVAGRVAAVHHLVLTRDAGVLTLESGTLYLLSPVGGRTVGAVFEGAGRFTLTPPIAIERGALAQFAGAGTLSDSITEAVLLFADSAGAALDALAWGAGEVPGDVGRHARDFVESLEGKEDGAFRAEVIEPWLNGVRNGMFAARLAPARGDALFFEYDPGANESVRLYRPVSRTHWGTNWAVITQFAPQAAPPDTAGSWEDRERLAVPHYVIDATLSQTFMADLDFAARATCTLRAEAGVGPWLDFGLDPDIIADSARWSDGTAAPVFKAKDDGVLWVRAPRALAPGDTAAFTVFYHSPHGKLIDRFANWFFINPGADWYPVNGEGKNLATFELTFASPATYPLATVGRKTDSRVDGKTVVSHWVVERPTPFATFNLGLFDDYQVHQPEAPALDIMMSEDAHRELARQAALNGVLLPAQNHMRENVAADVSNSLKWFTYLFGPPPFDHFYVTEIPYPEGVSFPGLIDLSLSTFQLTSIDGFDEAFRAHEVAHQWWGNGVGPGSYREKWLDEGLAEFSALWYLQTERKRNVEYFKFLDKYAADIRDLRGKTGPIWVGYRNATPDEPTAYQVTIYEKGAWVFHMLRILMLNLGTMNEDAFRATMRDYYQSFQGRPASTADFQSVVERHTGMPMDWFFDEWVKSDAIPTFHVAWKSEPADGGRYVVRFRIRVEGVPDTFRMPVLVSADLGGNRFAHFRVDVRGTTTDYTSPALPAAVKDLKFNDLDSVLGDVKSESW